MTKASQSLVMRFLGYDVQTRQEILSAGGIDLPGKVTQRAPRCILAHALDTLVTRHGEEAVSELMDIVTESDQDAEDGQ